MKIAKAPTACASFHLHEDAGKSVATVSARVNELLYETHELVSKPKRKDRLSGITVRPVGLPQKQMELF